MSNSPFFSIIIPTYNRAHLLARAIESVIEQSYHDWELIIVDDGSLDETHEVVNRYLPDKKIKYYWQKNKDVNAARNQGTKIAKGQYLTFLDDDDFYLPKHLEALKQSIESQNIPSGIFKTKMLIKLNNKSITSPLLPSENPIQAYWFFPSNLLSFAFHKSIFQELSFSEDFILAEDFHFIASALIRYPLIQVDEVTVVYEIQPESRSINYYSQEELKNKIAAITDIWIKHNELLSSSLPKYAYQWKINREYLHFARLAFSAGEKKLGWHYFSASTKKANYQLFSSYFKTFLSGFININKFKNRF